MIFFSASRCEIKDASPLLNCKKIEYVNLSGNFETTHLEEIAQLPTVHELQIANQKITDISFLKNCPQIRALDIGINSIKDMRPVFELPNLQFLRIYHNPFDHNAYDWTRLRDRGVYLVKDMENTSTMSSFTNMKTSSTN